DASSVSWVGDVRCYVRHPTSDVSVQLSRTSTAINTQMVNLGVPSPQNWGTYANYVQFVAPSSGLLSGVSFPNSAGGTGHAKAALFSYVNNLPAAVLATSAEITNPASGSFSLTFPTPYYVIAGQIYWVGVMLDTSPMILQSTSAPGVNV